LIFWVALVTVRCVEIETAPHHTGFAVDQRPVDGDAEARRNVGVSFVLRRNWRAHTRFQMANGSATLDHGGAPRQIKRSGMTPSGQDVNRSQP
jgi:hypothetical protein